jgi:hypothetical protein
MRRGTSILAGTAAADGEKEVLCLGRLGPCSPALSSNDHRRKRWLGRSAARKRRCDWVVAFGFVSRGVACSAVSAGSEGLSRFAVLVFLLREGKVAVL